MTKKKKHWRSCRVSKKKPLVTTIPTLIPYERLKELELGDRIWQAYINAKKEQQQ